MKERINEAKWSETKHEWRITIQRDGIRKDITCSIPGTRGKGRAERKADEWIKAGAKKKEKPVLFTDLRDGYLDDLGTDNGSAHKEKEASIIKRMRTWSWLRRPRWAGSSRTLQRRGRRLWHRC